MAATNCIQLVSYNMHGFCQGNLYLNELCRDADVIFVQEHWLYPSNLHLLNNISDEFVCFGVSAMTELTGKGILSGRPFGGVAILVRSNIAKNCHLVHKSERFVIVRYLDMLLINVYMPCKSVANYTDIYCDTLNNISAIISSEVHASVVFGGDLNFDFNVGGAVHKMLDAFLNLSRVVPTYNLLQGGVFHSYRHATLQATSLIDHFMVSDSLIKDVQGIFIQDDGHNLSDHLPVIMLLSLEQPTVNSGCKIPSRKADIRKLRWDKADLVGYYYRTFDYLSAIQVPYFLAKYSETHDLEYARTIIDDFYSHIILALHSAAYDTVPVCKQNFFKFWWDEECQILKDESVRMHRRWVAAGRPRDGEIANSMRTAKSQYKLHLRQKRRDEHACFTNELHEALLNKEFTAFWKTWNAKFGSKFNSQLINGLSDHGSIAEAFRDIFAAHAQPHDPLVNDKLKMQFQCQYDCWCALQY